MKTLIGIVVLASLVCVTRDVAAQPRRLDVNTCILCHGMRGMWEGDKLRCYLPEERLPEDVHFQAGLKCHDCHGGNPQSLDFPVVHAKDPSDSRPWIEGFRASLSEIQAACAKCHEKQVTALTTSVHAEAETPDGGGQATPLACDKCHGEIKHNLRRHDDLESPVFIHNQVEVCGGCHESGRKDYLESVHGHGLVHSGLLVTAACADCHGAHGILAPDDPLSTLHRSNVAATCAKCHRFIEERLQQSVHGGGNGPGGATDKPAPGGNVKRKPTCTDCHQGHDLANPKSVRFRNKEPDRCGTCHGELASQYGISMHGELTHLGYGSGAKCSDCHGAHDILPISNPDSRLSAANREETCRKCHPRAVAAFLDFDPHADHRNPERNPLLHWIYTVLLVFIFGSFGVFGLHSVLWFIRGSVDVLKNGRPRRMKPGDVAYIRFTPFHRIAHLLLLVSFLGLALTGLPLKYSDTAWAQVVSRFLGGFASTGVWHRIFGMVNIGCLAVYVVRMLGRVLTARSKGRSRWNVIFGPDSPIPNLRDAKEAFGMVRWFFGLGPRPTHERWAYWEKFDFWGAIADIVIIGLTGLILWFPNLFCAFLPGITLNIAKVIHSTQALLATGFVFAIHFFATHLRPDKFPMDMSMLIGLVSEEEFREERPKYYERLQSEGKLEQLKTTVPRRSVCMFAAFGGWIAVVVGVTLLAGILFGIFM